MKPNFIVKEQTKWDEKTEQSSGTGKYEVHQRTSDYSYEKVHVCDTYKEGHEWIKNNTPPKTVVMKKTYAVCLALPFVTMFYHKAIAETSGMLWDDMTVTSKVVVGIAGLITAFISGIFSANR